MTRPESLSAAQARRVTLAAQGFAGRRRAAGVRPSAASIRSEVARLRVLQIDSVNVWERNHYLPLFSRLGAYDRARLDALAADPIAPGALTEYWAHEATFLPVDDLPLFAFRQRRFAQQFARRHPEFERDTAALRAWLRDELAERGPLRAGDFEHEENHRTGPWWGWSNVKQCLQSMFLTGELVAAPRLGFERRYALPEQVLPAHALEVKVNEADAMRELVRRAAVALGVATVDELADYFRLSIADTRGAVHELADSGELSPVTVNGWTNARGAPVAAWLHRDAAMPGRIDRTALLSPFDPVVWYRDRALRIHDFHYRIEIYTPAHKRQFGYYTLPVLLGDRVGARVDLKNDRKARVLRVQSAWSEPHAPADAAPRIAAALREAAEWQGLESFAVQEWGDLAPALAAELRVPLAPREVPTPEPKGS